LFTGNVKNADLILRQSEGMDMAYGVIPFEKRIKENIKNYRLGNLFPMEFLQEYFKQITRKFQVDLLVTDRHGEKVFSEGNFCGFAPDVVENPGRKLKVQNRTIGHIYYTLERVAEEKLAEVEDFLNMTVDMLEAWGEDSYLRREMAAYLDELEVWKQEGIQSIRHADREDALTGVFQKSYFESRLQVIDRSEVVPVAVINANINDWKFVNDHFGDEESDRLIQVIADFLKEEAKPDYVIGRTDGDVFYIIIPMPEENETEEYCSRVQQRCMSFEDEYLAPSVAFGYVYKENVEEALADKLSDAEYEMFEHKMEMKKAPGYRERLEKGIK